MDPNANITEQRDLATRLRDAIAGDAEDTPFVEVGADFLRKITRLAELVLALDEWRTTGGFDPYENRNATTYEVKGRVTLADGSTSGFIIERDTGYQQWGADTERLGRTVDLVQAMADAVYEHFPTTEEDDE